MRFVGRVLARVPAPILVLAGVVSLQFGAAFAKGLFALVPPTTFVWLRLLTTAVILLPVAWVTASSAASRPRLRGHSRGDVLVVIGFGGCLAIMNFSIYQAMARIPLGMAVTLEFLGPLTVAMLFSRRPRDLIWAGLAAAGVAILGFSPHGLTPIGVGFALLAAAAWAGYILLSAETGRRWPGISGLALAGAVGAIGLAAPAIVAAGERLLRPEVLIIGLVVGLLSSVIPYSLELNALRRMRRGVFGILMSTEPAVATVAAMIILGEFLQPQQWLAVGCVIVASIGATRTVGPGSNPH